MSKKKSRAGNARKNSFLLGAVAGAVVTYILLQDNRAILPGPKGPASTLPGSSIPMPDGTLMGLPPQPLTIQRMSATYIP